MGAGESILEELQSPDPEFLAAAAVCKPCSASPGLGRSDSTRSQSRPGLRSRLSSLKFGGTSSSAADLSTSSQPQESGSDEKSKKGLASSIAGRLSKALLRKRVAAKMSSTAPGGKRTSIGNGLDGSESPTETVSGAACSAVLQLDGLAGKTNVVVFAACSKTPLKNVVFFPGDVQNFQETMAGDQRFCHWLSYSYENTVRSLRVRYPDANIILISPSRRHLGGYSCYDNFMECDMYGSPTHNAGELAAVQHLTMLMTSLSDWIGDQGDHSAANSTVSSGTATPTCGGTSPRVDDLLEPATSSSTQPTSSSPSSPASTRTTTEAEEAASTGNAAAAATTLAPAVAAVTTLAPAVAAVSLSPLASPAATSRSSARLLSPSANGTSKSRSGSAGADELPPLLSLPMEVVGFSKGCVVLNQLVHEMAAPAATASSCPLGDRQSSAESEAASGVAVAAAGLSVSAASVAMAAERGGATLPSVSTSSTVGSFGGGGGDDGGGGDSDDVISHTSAPSLCRSDSRRGGSVASAAKAASTSVATNSAAAAVASGNTAPATDGLFEALFKMVWLDGGHSGEKDAWITDSQLVTVMLATLKGIEVHTTPYQTKNSSAGWKATEYCTFARLLRQAALKTGHCKVVVFEHNKHCDPSLRTHFRLLDTF